MKLKQNQSSIPQQISKSEIEHPWLPHPPNPPTPEAVAKAQFIDKTYVWRGSAAAKAAGSEPRN